MRMRVLAVDDRHPDVVELRRRLAALGLVGAVTTDPEYFDDALAAGVRLFQQQRGLNVDAVVGPDTRSALEAARWRLGDRTLRVDAAHHLVGDDVADLQSRLLALGFPVRKVDGVFGPQTEACVRAFQRSTGLAADGVAGPETVDAFASLRRAVSGGAPHALREQEEVYRTGGELTGRVILLDPGHAGHADTAVDGPSAWALLDIVRRMERRLVALGTTVVLSRADDEWPGEAERAARANAVGADLALSLTCDRSASPAASGVAGFYFGTERFGASSAVGHELAGLAVREIAARTGLADCRAHARAWAFLNRTSMPAVRLSVGYVSNPADSLRLADPAFRDVVAEAVVIAVQRVHLVDRPDIETGVLDVQQLRALV